MKKLLLAFALAFALAVLAPLAAAQSPGKVDLSAGLYLIHAEVASSFAERMQGLMHREKLGPNDGMLFVFDEPGIQCMWMKNTLVPLSVAYLADDGSIVNIEDMKPQTEDSHCTKKPVRFALEVNLGWFASKGLHPGAKLRGLEKFPAAR